MGAVSCYSLSVTKPAAALLALLACAPAFGRMGAESLLAALDAAPAAEKPLLARALGRRGKRKSIPELLKRFKPAEDPELARAIAAALGDLGGPEAAAGLRSAWLAAGAEPLRPTIAEALGRLGDREALPLLLEALRSSDPALAAAAAEALGGVDAPASLEALRAAPGPEALCGLARLGDAAARERLRAAPPEDLDAAVCLARLDRGPGLERLLAGARAPEPEARAAAAERLGRARNPRGELTLGELLADAAPAVRLAAASALEGIASDRARYLLGKRRKEPDPEVRERVRRALAVLGDYESPLLGAQSDGQ